LNKCHEPRATKKIHGSSLPGVYLILSSGLLNPPRRFMYCLQVRTFLTFAEPSWFPSTCFPLVVPKPAIPIAAIMASSSWLTTSIDSPSSWSFSTPSLCSRGSGIGGADSSFGPGGGLTSVFFSSFLSRGVSSLWRSRSSRLSSLRRSSLESRRSESRLSS